MATAYTELNPDQQALLQNADTLLRKAILSARATLTAMKAFDLAWNDPNLQAAFSQLDPAQNIPKVTGLIGTSDLPGSEFVAQDGIMQQLIGAWDTAQMRTLHTGIVGAINIDGQG